ncbi:glycerophosphodiester phosphodiesterase [Halopelagius longus]|uniref:Glycerophosphodiester phosphodiesterase n=1 Tax=Halopelagius longus TaxID=1236180 RepID=A0A1H1BHX9_9EURY|nr:glycerophosphodiester phosphodiesterase [Halopelagius longus]RDI70793.1 glycerophosphodiester phosphodiesterase [Halopelagius longus]SDQ51542.1 glycerophosphoryl diester phosphodiesterase [Halopelagius longus]
MSRDKLTLGRRAFVAGTGAAVGTASVGGVASAHEDGSSKEKEKDKEKEKKKDETPKTIAHRGFAGQYPENTLGAFERATMCHDPDMVEIDIIPASDGTVMVTHDPKMSSRDGGERGLTEEDGYVWDYTPDELNDIEVQESGETIPTLEQSLEVIPSDVAVNIEFKNPGAPSDELEFATNLSGDALETQKELWRPLAERTLDVASEFENDILVSSFYEAALATVRDVDSDVPIAFLFWDSIEEGLKITREYDCEAVHPPYNMIKGAPFFNDEYYVEADSFEDIDLVQQAHDEGRTVNTWTVTTWYQAEQLAAAGVDGLIADYPNLMWNGGSPDDE